MNTFFNFSQQVKQQEILRSKTYQSKNITRIHAKGIVSADQSYPLKNST